MNKLSRHWIGALALCWLTAASLLAQTPPLATPANVVATPGDRQVSLHWDASPGAILYGIFRGTAPGQQADFPIGTTSKLSYGDATVDNETTYYYQIKALSALNPSDYSKEVSAKPSASLAKPDAPVLRSAPSGAAIQLTWSAPPQTVTRYRVLRGTASGYETPFAIVTSGVSFLDTEVTPGTTYFYLVAAENGSGIGAFSNEISMQAGSSLDVPSVPTNVKAAGGRAIVLTWNAPTGPIDSYTILRGTTAATKQPIASNIATAVFKDETVTVGASYVYAVVAVNGAGQSAPSVDVPVTALDRLTAPWGLTATAGNGEVRLDWKPSAGTQFYTVRRSLTPDASRGVQIGGSVTAAYLDTAAVNGTKYYYAVQAADGAGGYSAFSEDASATPVAPAVAPGAPTLSINPTTSSIQLSWTVPSGTVTSYTVQRGTLPGQETTLQANVSGTTFTDSNVTATTIYYYRVLAVNDAGSTVSNEVSATLAVVVAPPTITTQPTNRTVTAGQTATFSVVAAGTGPFTYQWLRNNTNINGANSASYTTAATTASDSGATFAVKVTNSAGNVTSNAATLTVNPAPVAPSITTQPTNQTVTAGQTATFSVVAAGTAPLTYQWLRNNTNINGATSASYTTAATTISDSGATFAVKVTNSTGNVTSNVATLTVNPAPVAPSITTQPTNQTVTAGQTATFSVVAAGTAPLTYQWLRNNTNINGATSASYTTAATTISDSGATFAVKVTNSTGNVTSNTATLTVNAAVLTPTIVTQPTSQSVAAGQTATFSVSVTGTAPFTYQWRKNGTAISGANGSSYTTPAATSADDGTSFTVRVTNSAGSVTSNAATLSVQSFSEAPATTAEAARFLNQATFGATDADITALMNKPGGYAQWIDEQMALAPQFNYHKYASGEFDAKKDKDGCDKYGHCELDAYVLDDAYTAGLVQSQDQLRQRMIWALSQIMVISRYTGDLQDLGDATAEYTDVLSRDSFVNFRKLIEDVTLNPAMGIYLSFWYNDKGDPDAGTTPDQNYAREVMQLFTIGLQQLNPDGTPVLGRDGKPKPTYTQDDIYSVAATLTGWGASTDPNWTYNTPGLVWQGQPLIPNNSHHSTIEKKFLGVTIPANPNSDARADLKTFLDTLVNHPNVGPFIGKQLIQKFVTSNPSPGYVTRVTQAFNDNGSGVRGDMKAVIKAVLLDPEARGQSSISDPNFGRVREQFLRYAHLLRAVNAKANSSAGIYADLSVEGSGGGYGLETFTDTFAPYSGQPGQIPFNAPTVFNFYTPDFSPSGTDLKSAGLLAPELQTVTESSVSNFDNFLQATVFGPNQAGIRLTYSTIMAVPFDYSKFTTLVDKTSDQKEFLDRVNLLFLSGQMSDNFRALLLSQMGQDKAAGMNKLDRVGSILRIVAQSPEYVVQK